MTLKKQRNAALEDVIIDLHYNWVIYRLKPTTQKIRLPPLHFYKMLSLVSCFEIKQETRSESTPLGECQNISWQAFQIRITSIHKILNIAKPHPTQPDYDP